MGHAITPWVFTALALGELVADQLPSTPSRKVPMQFGARLLSGALCGATIGIASGAAGWSARIAGVVGAVIGTLGGAAARAQHGGRFRQGPAGGADRRRRRHRRRHPGRGGPGMSRKFDAIIIGAGQAGPSLAGRLTRGRHERGAGRAPSVRRHLRQHRLHADQGAGRQRLCRASGAPRRRVRREHRRRGRRRHEEGPCTRDDKCPTMPATASRAGCAA